MVQILTIDDDPIIQMILRRTLQEQGYEVIAAESGEEGLLRVQQYNPALILCDWQMSGKDGLEVCRQIKSDPNRASTFFILLTARTAAADRMAGLDAGADEFLAKPIEVNELKATVKAGLRMHQSAQALQKLTADLETQKQRLEIELAGAAEYVRSLLPAPLTGAITIDWRFLPAHPLGGDYFDYFWLDSDCLVVYLLDMSDHCFKSVLALVSIHHLLRSHSLPNTNLYQPQTVLTALKDVFQMGNPDERYFTIWYGIYNQATRQLDYASAGHPPAVLVSETEVQQLTAREIRSVCLRRFNVAIAVGFHLTVRYISSAMDCAKRGLQRAGILTVWSRSFMTAISRKIATSSRSFSRCIQLKILSRLRMTARYYSFVFTSFLLFASL
jgi:sigma-B regulation protein RsbU (phosphoserine phosphatase)